MSSTESLHNYLRMYRHRLALTQRDVATLIGASEDAVRKHEAGERLPPLESLLAYEVVLESPITELFAGVAESVRSGLQRRAGQLLASIEASGTSSLRIASVRRLADDKPLGGHA
jgi:DNA-binding XRE family transcriptional regulator